MSDKVEQYAQWLIANEDKRGTPDFETVAEAYRSLRSGTEAPQEQPTTRQKIQSSLPMRVVQGLRDPIDAGAQLLPRGLEFVTSVGGLAPNPVSEFFGSEAKRVDQGISENEAEYEKARRVTATSKEGPGFDGGRLLGNIVSPANAAIATKFPAAASTGMRIFQGGLLGATGGALTPVDTQQNPDFVGTKAGQVALGAATGAVATPALGKIGDWVGAKLSGMRKPDDAIIMRATEEYARDMGMDWSAMAAKERQGLFEQVKLAAAANAGKDPASIARANDFRRTGIPFLTGQATREPGQWAFERNASQLPGIGDEISARLADQGRLLRQKFGAYGAGASSTQEAGGKLVGALREYDDKLSKAVSDAYKTARNAAGKDVEVPLQGIAQDFATVLDDFGDKVPSGVINQFKKYGIAPGGDMTQRKLFTVEEADRLLKVINANVSNDPSTNKALDALRNAVKRAVTQEGGADDVFSGARAAAASRFKLQDAVPALEASASGRVNPDTFVQSFIVSKNAQTDQVKKLASILEANNPQAFDEARAQIGAYLQRMAFGENPAGDAKINPAQLSKALREIGEGKLGAFFSPEEVAQIQSLTRVGAYIESVPVGRMPNTSGNWGAITSLASKIPGVPTSIGLANALRSGVSNQMRATQSLSGNLPTKMNPQDIELLSKLLSGAALTSGGTGASALR